MDNAASGSKASQEDKSLHELLGPSVVKISVGPNSTEWTVHERLLCHYSEHFRDIFHDSDSAQMKSHELPNEEDAPFEALVAWLYARSLKTPKSEEDVGHLLDLYLLANKLKVEKLEEDVVEAVREWYHGSGTYPGLRRVQYIYNETSEDNAMREMMVSSVARQLTVGDKIPAHWAKALQRNGQLAVDIIRAIQQWHIEERSIPDARDGSSDRGRLAKSKFSAVEEDRGESVETVETTDTDLGVKSISSETEHEPDHSETNVQLQAKAGGEE